MPLTAVEPPEAVRRAAAMHLHALAGAEMALPPLREAAVERLVLAAPHRVYTLGLDAAATGGIHDARPAGWRFLVTEGDHVVASAEVATDAGERASANAGPYVRATAETIELLEQEPAVASGAFELRLLKIPALYVAAAWAVDDHGLVMPLAPAPSQLEAGHAYGEEEFMAVLRDMAGAVSAMDDGLSGG